MLPSAFRVKLAGKKKGGKREKAAKFSGSLAAKAPPRPSVCAFVKHGDAATTAYRKSTALGIVIAILTREAATRTMWGTLARDSVGPPCNGEGGRPYAAVRGGLLYNKAGKEWGACEDRAAVGWGRGTEYLYPRRVLPFY